MLRVDAISRAETPPRRRRDTAYDSTRRRAFAPVAQSLPDRREPVRNVSVGQAPGGSPSAPQAARVAVPAASKNAKPAKQRVVSPYARAASQHARRDSPRRAAPRRWCRRWERRISRMRRATEVT